MGKHSKANIILAPIHSYLRKFIRKYYRPPYIYEATVIRWVDGDTVELVVDVGFYLNFGREDNPVDFRLYGIDTPERGDTDYDVATAYAEGMAPAGSTVLVKSIKDRKGRLSDDFGRYIGIVYIPGEEKSVNESLVDVGLAVVKHY